MAYSWNKAVTIIAVLYFLATNIEVFGNNCFDERINARIFHSTGERVLIISDIPLTFCLGFCEQEHPEDCSGVSYGQASRTCYSYRTVGDVRNEDRWFTYIRRPTCGMATPPTESPVTEITFIEGPPGYAGYHPLAIIPGVLGIHGETGATGLLGVQGPPGAKGIAAGPIPNDRIAEYTGVKGEKGDKGMIGVGEPCQPGTPGDPCAGIATGARGIRGSNGTRGATGDPGDSVAGATGATGLKGGLGGTGPRGPPGAPGTPLRFMKQTSGNKNDPAASAHLTYGFLLLCDFGTVALSVSMVTVASLMAYLVGLARERKIYRINHREMLPLKTAGAT